MPSRTCDVIVVGAGPAGENLAGRTARAGLETVIVESELVGGECSYWACIPSKTLLRPVEALAEARAVSGSRQAATGTLDAQAVLARRDEFVSNWKDDSAVEWLRREHIDLLRGRGRITGERRVAVTGPEGQVTELEARHAVAIATGSGPSMPKLPGLDQARPWTSREATSAKRVPQSLVVLGGGVVACEMATAWHGLGTEQVAIVQRGARLLAGFEPFAGERVRKALEARGVRVLTDASAARVERGAGGVRLTLASGETLAGEELLVATGREPRTRDLGLESVGLTAGAWLEVDDCLRVKQVTPGWLYAIGDVNHLSPLTHMGKYQGRIAGDAIAARARGEKAAAAPEPWSRFAATASRRAVPQVVFTDPEVAAVGFTEAQARERGLEIRLLDFDLVHVSGAAVRADHFEGQARMLVDERRRVLVGMTLVGQDVGEMIHAATIAVVGEVPLERLWHAVPSFPTMNEVWLRLLEEYGM